MKIIFFGLGLFILLLFSQLLSLGQSGIGIGTSTPNAHAILDVVSNNKGVLVPRLTTAQRTAMSSSLSANENGLLVFDADMNEFYFWDGSNWKSVTLTQDLQLVGSTLKITNNSTATDIDLAPFSGTNTDNQTLSLAGTNLTITGGNTLDLVSIQDGVDDADNNPTNEIQDINTSGAAGNISLSSGSTLTLNVDDADNNPTNEIQTLSKIGSTVSLSHSGGSFTDAVNDADANASNELITGASLMGTTLRITDAGGNTDVNLVGLQDGVNDADADPSNEIQDLQLVGNILTITNNASPTSINLAAFSGTNTDNQTLSLAGTNLTITGGNTLDLASLQDGVDDADNNPTNEIQDISTSGGSGNISLSSGSTLTLNVDDADASVTNELQTINRTGVTVTLSDGGGSFNVNDADASATNEIQDISTSGGSGNISLSSGSTLTLNVDDADASVTNELQTINRTGVTVTLSDGGGSFNVNDADASASNELIIGAALSGTTLRITDAGGNTDVNLSSLAGSGTDDQQLSIATDVLTLEDGGPGIDLSTYRDNTDNQNLANVLANGASAGNVRITNLASPLNPNDAARRKFVDDLVAAQDHTDNQTLSFNTSTNRLTISGGNFVTLPTTTITQEAFKVYLSGNLTVPGGSGTAINFNVEDYDLNGTIAGGKYIPPVNGIYAFNGVFNVRMAETSQFSITILVNGSVAKYSIKNSTVNKGAGIFNGFGFSTELQLSAGDVVEFVLSSGGIQLLEGGIVNQTHVSGRLVIEL